MTGTLRSTAPLLVIGILALAEPARGTDLFVKPTGSGAACAQSSPCSLATAIATAAADDSVYLAAGVYTGTGTEVVLLDETVSLLGGWSGAPSGAVVRDPVAHESILDGENARRVVKITGGAPTLDGLTIRRGNASGLGGDCGLTPAFGCGGGVLVALAGLTVTNCRFTDNQALDAVAGASALGYGGGLHAYRASSLVIAGSTFMGNVAAAASDGCGGALDAFAAEGGHEVRGSRFVDNRGSTGTGTDGYGGAVALRSCRGVPAEIKSSIFAGNVARTNLDNTNADGNAVYVNSSVATLTGNSVRSDAVGFAVGVFSSDVVVTGNTLTSRTDGSTLYFYVGLGDGSVVSNNVLAGGSFATLRAHGSGGGPVGLHLSHNTIVNSATSTGVLIGDHATATLRNNVVAGHVTAIRTEGNGFVTAERTLFFNNTVDGIRGADPIDGDPLFVNATAGDFHIQEGSAAIGAGVDAGVATDIDGEARPGLGGIDVGADELAPRRFDFGTPGSPVAAGYAQVTHATTFTPERGFGWNYGTIASRDRGAASSDIRRDFCFTHTATFAVTIPNGRYWVTLTMGDAAAGHSQMAVFFENRKVAVVSTAGNEFRTMTFDAAVTDGELTVWLNDEGGSDPNVVINALEIREALPTMVDLGTASSPLAPGWVRGTHASAYDPGAGFGWLGGIVQSRDRGTVDPLLRDLVFTPRGLLGMFLPNGVYDVLLTLGDAAGAHNQMGVSVQGSAFDQVSSSKNQFVTRRYRAYVADNRLDILLDDLEGPDVNAVLNAVEVRTPPLPRFDFGTAASPVAGGMIQVTHQTTYTPTRGYGWASGVIGSRDRALGSSHWRDFNFTPDGTFVVDVLPGRYQVDLCLGDATTRHEQMAVSLEGTLAGTYTVSAGDLACPQFFVSVTDGQLTLRIADQGGSDPNAVINVLEIR
jgi:hypothetical protein